MTKISKTVSAPIKVIKKTGKELLQPAGKENVYKIAVGVAVSPLVSYGYGKMYDFIIGFVPNIPNWLKTVIKIFLPLVPVPIVSKTRIPAGAVINGGLIGVFVVQVVEFFYSMITGKSLFPSITKGKVSAPYSLEETGAEAISDWGAF